MALFPGACPPFLRVLLGISPYSANDLRQKGSEIKLVNGAEGRGKSSTGVVSFGVCVKWCKKVSTHENFRELSPRRALCVEYAKPRKFSLRIAGILQVRASTLSVQSKRKT